MSNINTIFSKDTLIKQSSAVQKVRYNREHLLTTETAKELNTYLNFGIFPTFTDTQTPVYDKNNDYQRTEASKAGGTPGVRSIFNRAGAVLLGSKDGDYNVDITNGDAVNNWRIQNNVPLMDSPKARQRIRQNSGCSIKELVEASSAGLMGQETYAYSDFMYCKHLGKVSNNYMITLRRFPLPVDDFIGSLEETPGDGFPVSKNASCIGCMITWLGVSGNNMSEILKYNYKMPFKEETADRQSLQGSADENQSPLNNIFSVFDKTYREQYQAGYAGEAANAAFGYLGIRDLGNPPYKNVAGWEDSLKVYGPVDTVRSTYVRSDEGLTFTQNFTLTFEYELRSYNGINGKQAMLDLISNILNVTYTTGSFWGGGYKGFAAHQSNIFANLNAFKAKGGFTNFIDAFSNDLSNLGKGIGASIGWDPKNPGTAIKNAWNYLINNVGGMILSGMLNRLGRPQKVMYNSLLSPAPIGFWHVTIGNPKRPIMSIGNMVITDVQFEHVGPLGLDDFPTGIKVSVSLDRGKPRDLRDIEKLYMRGNDRIYTSMGEKVFDMYRNAELYKNNRHDLNNYNPVSNIATINIPTDNKTKPTVTVDGLEKVKLNMKKYFGTDDAYSIYIPAAEQEFGSGKKKPSTEANKNAVGGDGNTAKTGGYYGGGK